MRGHRVVWGAIGAVVAAAGLVWLFVALGTEEADRISSGVGAGAAVVGLIVGALGVVKRRAEPPNTHPAAAAQSVENSVIGGANVQVGGSVRGSVTATGDASQERDR